MARKKKEAAPEDILATADQEVQGQTTAPEEATAVPEAPELIAEPQEPDAATEDLQQEEPEPQEAPELDAEPNRQAPEPVPPEKLPLPYRATVAVSIAVVHKAVGIGTADMLKPVGSLRQGTPVTVVGRKGPFAKLKNGLFMKETFLTA